LSSLLLLSPSVFVVGGGDNIVADVFVNQEQDHGLAALAERG